MISDNLLMAFDANSLYPLAMSHLDSFYPKLETDFVYTNHMNEELVDNINRTFGNKITELQLTQDNFKYYYPKKSLQHVPVKEKAENAK